MSALDPSQERFRVVSEHEFFEAGGLAWTEPQRRSPKAGRRARRLAGLATLLGAIGALGVAIGVNGLPRSPAPRHAPGPTDAAEQRSAPSAPREAAWREAAIAGPSGPGGGAPAGHKSRRVPAQAAPAADKENRVVRGRRAQLTGEQRRGGPHAESERPAEEPSGRSSRDTARPLASAELAVVAKRAPPSQGSHATEFSFER
jgi:hypothetical protein